MFFVFKIDAVEEFENLDSAIEVLVIWDEYVSKLSTTLHGTGDSLLVQIRRAV